MVAPGPELTRGAWPQVLVVGWGQQGFMEALLHELDRGSQSLPVGSEVVFLNTQDVDSTVGAAAERVRINCLHVTHIQVRAPQPPPARRCIASGICERGKRWLAVVCIAQS
jgi:hypothetical protein